MDLTTLSAIAQIVCTVAILLTLARKYGGFSGRESVRKALIRGKTCHYQSRGERGIVRATRDSGSIWKYAKRLPSMMSF